jgi:hypothetical protein
MGEKASLGLGRAEYPAKKAHQLQTQIRRDPQRRITQILGQEIWRASMQLSD